LIAQHLQRFLPPGSKLLDVGCGTGALVSQLVQKGYRAVGVDPQNAKLAERKRGESSLDLRRASAEDLPFSDEEFDAVIFADVLEHIEEGPALNEAFRVLAPGGILLLTVPAFAKLWSARDEEAGHLRRYAPADIRRLAGQFDAAVVRVGFYQFFLFPLFALSRLCKVPPHKEQVLPNWLNRLFFRINAVEIHLGRWVRWPVGSSLVAVLRKKSDRSLF